MKDIITLIRLKRYLLGYTIRILSKLTGINHGILTQIETGKIALSQYYQEKIFKALSIDEVHLFDYEQEVEELYLGVMRSSCYFEPNQAKMLTRIEEDLISSSIHYPKYLVAKFIYHFHENPNFEPLDLTKQVLIKVLTNQDELYVHAFFLYMAAYMVRDRDYQSAEKLLKQVKIEEHCDEFVSMYYYYYAMIKEDMGLWGEALLLNEQARILFKKTNNVVREVFTLMSTANVLTNLELYESAIKQFAKVKKYLAIHQIHISLDLINENIGWCYILKHEYEKSIEILEAIEDHEIKDNRYYFYLMFAYYKIKNYEVASQYALLSSSARKNSLVCTILCDIFTGALTHHENYRFRNKLEKLYERLQKQYDFSWMKFVSNTLEETYLSKEDYKQAYFWSKKSNY